MVVIQLYLTLSQVLRLTRLKNPIVTTLSPGCIGLSHQCQGRYPLFKRFVMYFVNRSDSRLQISLIEDVAFISSPLLIVLDFSMAVSAYSEKPSFIVKVFSPALHMVYGNTINTIT